MRRWSSVDTTWLSEAVIVLVIAAAMALPSLLWLLQGTLGQALSSRGGGAIVLFLTADSPVILSRLEASLMADSLVQDTERRNAEESSAEFAAFLGLSPDDPALSGVEIPPSLTVSLQADTTIEAVQPLLARWQSWPEVSNLYWSQDELERSRALYRLVRRLGAVLTWILLLAGIVVIAASVAGRMAQQKDSMVVMTLIGAPYSFILWPFLIHALLLGILAAALAALLLSVGLAGLDAPLESLQNLLGAPVPKPDLGLGALLSLFIGGPALAASTTAWIVHRELDKVEC